MQMNLRPSCPETHCKHTKHALTGREDVMVSTCLRIGPGADIGRPSLTSGASRHATPMDPAVMAKGMVLRHVDRSEDLTRAACQVSVSANVTENPQTRAVYHVLARTIVPRKDSRYSGLSALESTGWMSVPHNSGIGR